MKNKTNLKNVFDQLSNVDNVDDILRDEGLFPKTIVENGMDRINHLLSKQESKTKLIDLIKSKMANSVNKKTLKAFKSLSDLASNMDEKQINMVFRSLNNLPESNADIDQMIQNLKSDSDLQKIINKYKFGKDN